MARDRRTPRVPRLSEKPKKRKVARRWAGVGAVTYHLATAGMGEADGPGMQVQLAADSLLRQERSSAAILAVAENGRAELHAMGAELMRPPGARLQGQPGSLTAGALDDAVLGDRRQSILVGTDPLAGNAKAL